MGSTEPIIRFFFYGTLMRGECQHGLVAPFLKDAEPARVWGRLFQLEAGYPALEVPDQSVLATGSANPQDDAAAAKHYEGAPLKMHAGDWGWVHGEVVTLREPAQCLPPLDAYEGFQAGQESLFQRVLLPAASDRATLPTWTYIRVAAAGGIRIQSGLWTS